jgi:hypothetical protein
MELAVRLKYIGPEELRPIQSLCVILGKQLYHLRNALLKRLRQVPGPRSLAPGPQTF